MAITAQFSHKRTPAPCGSNSPDGRLISSKPTSGGWGGARANSGGARPNAGGARPGAGRKPAPPVPPVSPPPDVPRWYCVRTFPHGELTADTEIRLAGFTVFAPTLFKPAEPPRRIANGAMRPGKPDRVAPLFPRYLFVRFSRSEKWQRIRYLPGVAGFLYAAPDQPAAVPDQVIELIRGLCAPNGCLYPPKHAPLFPAGVTARLMLGPMADLSGVCTWSNGQRVKLLMHILGRPVSVTVAQSSVEAV